MNKYAMINRETNIVENKIVWDGISKYELNQYEEAIIIFDKALKIYPTLSDAKYYKAVCLVKLGKKEEANKLLEEAKKEPKDGYFINEDNAVYETYPYQVRWK